MRKREDGQCTQHLSIHSSLPLTFMFHLTLAILFLITIPSSYSLVKESTLLVMNSSAENVESSCEGIGGDTSISSTTEENVCPAGHEATETEPVLSKNAR